jgi:hypothetical protein
MIWISRDTISKFENLNMYFERLGTGMTPKLSMGASGAFYSFQKFNQNKYKRKREKPLRETSQESHISGIASPRSLDG